MGKGCFFATGNILTSVDVDRGEFKVPCMTHMSRSEGRASQREVRVIR